MKKKKYTIIHNLTATVEIAVLAETEEEAFEIAAQNNIDPRDYNFELVDAGIGDVEDVPDLDETMAKAETIIKKAEEEEISFDLSPWPCIEAETWNGIDYNSKKELTENVFWDKHFDEIAFTLDSGAEVNMSELPKLQQLEICLQIISQAEENGVDVSAL